MAYNFPYYGQQPYPYTDQLNQLRNPNQIPMPNYQMPLTRPDPTGLNWVQGEAGAKSWFVAPGSTVLLMDAESMRFYLKTADASGVPSMRTFEYNEVGAIKPQEPTSAPQYVTVDEFNQFRTEVLSKLDAPVEVSLSRRGKKGAEIDE